MPNKIRFCLLCKRYDRKSRSSYTRIYTVEREAKLIEGYRRRNNGQELNQSVLNELVHQKCYNRIVQGVSTDDTNKTLMSTEENQNESEDEQEQDQTSLIQFRSRMPFPSNVNKHLFERRQRVCAICNRYGYRSHNKMKQVVSNFMANKLAEGYLHVYKKPYSKSLLDAYIHETCFRKLYSSYRYHVSKKFMNRNFLQQPFNRQVLYSPHETRSRSGLHKSSIELESSGSTPMSTTDDTPNLSIEKLFATPFYTSIATTNPTVELSARTGLFRPCIQRLTLEEIEIYTKKKLVLEKSHDDNITNDQLSIDRSNFIPTSERNDSLLCPNPDNDDHDIQLIEQDPSPNWTPSNTPLLHSMFNKTQKIYTTTAAAAKIRRRYLKPPPLAKPTNPLISDHTYTSNNIRYQKTPPDIEKLYHWLIEELKTSGNPISMGDVLTKYKEQAQEDNTNNNNNNNATARENVHRERLKHQLEKYYSNQFVFVTPNKREGTFVALNDIENYIRLAIKNLKQEKEKAAEASILSPIVVQAAPVDYKRQTCEAIMNGIRKIRLYIRDPQQIKSSPSILMRNVIGLITASERQFHKVSQQYDFYRMIDDDLFETTNAKVSNKYDRTLRNMSLASDLISARHDNRVSEKHYSLANQFVGKNFNCTPKNVITLLNRYGHTCSYKSYMKMKAARQQTTNDLGQVIIEEIENIIRDDDKSSDCEMESMGF